MRSPRIMLSIPQVQLQEAQKFANEKGLPLSSVVRLALSDYLAKQKTFDAIYLKNK